MAIDEALVDEINLYAMNDRSLYDQRILPIIRNYARKKVRGTWDKEKAIKGIKINIVPEAWRKYRREFRMSGTKMSDKEKEEAAKGIFSDIKEQIQFEVRRIKNQEAKKEKGKNRKRK